MISHIDPAVARQTKTDTRARAACAFAFVMFFPYPAIAIGNSSGVTIAHVAALLTLAHALLKREPLSARGFAVWASVMGVMTLSALANSAFGTAPSEDVLWKVLVSAGATILVLPATATMINRGLRRSLVDGAAAAVFVHAVIGALQIVSFARGEFPLLWLYRNPSFSYVPDTADAYVRYVRRPFGLFPEPSAMVACVAPVLIIVVADLLYTPSLGNKRRWIYTGASLAGIVLCIGSKSGGTLIVLPALALIVVPYARARKAISVGALLKTPIMLAAVAVALATALSWMDDRASVYSNRSWEARASSIAFALDSVDESARSLLIGYGPGQSTAILRTADIAGFVPRGGLTIAAIWSVGARFLMEMGLLTFVPVAVGARFLLTNLHAARRRAVLVALLFVWLANVLMGTSYMELTALWFSLAFILLPPSVAVNERTFA